MESSTGVRDNKTASDLGKLQFVHNPQLYYSYNSFLKQKRGNP